jgi:hypothetical protein
MKSNKNNYFNEFFHLINKEDLEIILSDLFSEKEKSKIKELKNDRAGKKNIKSL